LPSNLVAFSSAEGKHLFKRALTQGGMENFFNLAEQFTTQSEPEYCGPASLIMVLNALQVDPQKRWKGVWRWFSEEVLHCSDAEVMRKGMTLD
jgi:glutathione gamma-glutamylcysteinyltransferase